ncbi:TRAP transporter small permease subunit [Henriciella aquimarina]|uniref:TRAP transporter small permease subunit n=1 Tax=Henriciella aquimarina TaxID=545261 RepID=UPI0009FC9950|nr:TRAP transporter small permease subunit [Henriciella aquimarina]
MDPALFLKLGAFLKWIGICLLPVFLLPLLTLVMPGTFGRLTKFVSAQIDRATHWALIASAGCAMALVLFQLIVVIASYAFALSWTWMSELVIYAFAAMFMLGAASALKDDAHVRVDILRPRFGEDGRNWIELAGTYFFLFPICIRLLMTGEQGLTRSWSLFEGSRESDGLPILFLFKTLVPVFAVLMLAQGLSVASKAALRLTGQTPPDDEAKPAMSSHYGA